MNSQMITQTLSLSIVIIQLVHSLDDPCPGGPSAPVCTPLTVPEKQYILDWHNEIRDRVAGGEADGSVSRQSQPAATNMNQLMWDDGLAAVAQAYAESCPDVDVTNDGTVLSRNENAKFEIVAQRDANNTKWGTANGPTMGNSTHPFIYVGENIVAAESLFVDFIEDVLGFAEFTWFYEQSELYTYNAITGGICAADSDIPTCNNYLQMVWASTRYVGCGYVSGCGNTGFKADEIVVCNYFPAANISSTIGGSSLPYEEAANDGLISSNCPADRTPKSSFFDPNSYYSQGFFDYYDTPQDALCNGPACATACDGQSISEETCNHCVNLTNLDTMDGTDGINGGRLLEATRDPTQFPTANPSANPTSAPTQTPTPDVGQACGTNRFCYYVDIYPLVGNATQETVAIAALASDLERYFDVFISVKNETCVNPSISFVFEEIDFSSSSEWLDVYDNNGSRIERCPGSEDSNCDKWIQCLTKRRLGVDKIENGDVYKLSVTEAANVNRDICDHGYSTNAQLTIHCSGDSCNPTTSPTENPTVNPTVVTANPSQNPSSNPTKHPTNQPSENPTTNPSVNPSVNPTANPSANPSSNPTMNPSVAPSEHPTVNPTRNPSQNPSSDPSLNPTTASPSINPSASPSLNPSANPSTTPTNHPSENPTMNPSLNPSVDPTLNPSANPTRSPSSDPTVVPSKEPSLNPTTSNPTMSPSLNPTMAPTPIPININGTMIGSVSGAVNAANSLFFVLNLATNYEEVNVSTCSSTANQFAVELNVSDSSGAQTGFATNSCPNANQQVITLTNAAAGQYTIFLGNLGGSASNPLPNEQWLVNVITATFSPTSSPTTSTTSTTESQSDSSGDSNSDSDGDSSDDVMNAALNEEEANDLFGYKSQTVDDEEYEVMLHFGKSTYYNVWAMLAVVVILNLFYCLFCRKQLKKNEKIDDQMPYV